MAPCQDPICKLTHCIRGQARSHTDRVHPTFPAVQTQPLWERPAMAPGQDPICKLTHCIREQARSHIDRVHPTFPAV